MREDDQEPTYVLVCGSDSPASGVSLNAVPRARSDGACGEFSSWETSEFTGKRFLSCTSVAVHCPALDV